MKWLLSTLTQENMENGTQGTALNWGQPKSQFDRQKPCGVCVIHLVYVLWGTESNRTNAICYFRSFFLPKYELVHHQKQIRRMRSNFEYILLYAIRL